MVAVSPCRGRMSVAFILFVVVGVGAGAPNAMAALGDCTTSNQDHPYTNSLKKYRVNSTSFDLLPGVSRDEGVTAAIAGADTWNEQGSSGYFRFLGTTTRTIMPETLVECAAQGINYSLIAVYDNDGPKAETDGRCKDANGVPQYFHIGIRTNDGAGVPWNWDVGTISSTEWDLVQTLTHEFGHTLRLGHPSSTEQAVMTPTSIGTNRSRDLYEWDMQCLHEISGYRSLTPYYRYHSGGVLGAESLLPTAQVTKISAGVSKYAGYWQWSSAYPLAPICLAWERPWSGSAACAHSTIQDSIGPTEVTWRENEARDRIIFPEHYESPQYVWNATHSARYVYSDNGFTSTYTGILSTCSFMSGWFTCKRLWGNPSVKTGKPLSFAWDDRNNRTVTAWVRQNRANDSQSREVMVAVGHISDSLLPTPTSLGVQSSVSPGVACKLGAAGGYDCILAFVDQADGLNRVSVRRFSAVAGSKYYTLNMDPTIHQVSSTVYTAGRIAAWHHSGYFWLAMRPLNADQHIGVVKSSNGSSWSVVGTYGESVIGPSAASYWTGNNLLLYAR